MLPLIDALEPNLAEKNVQNDPDKATAPLSKRFCPKNDF